MVKFIQLFFISYFLQFHNLSLLYRYDFKKQEECGVVAHERLAKLRVTMKLLLAKPRSFLNLPAFLDLNGSRSELLYFQDFSEKWLVLIVFLNQKCFYKFGS